MTIPNLPSAHGAAPGADGVLVPRETIRAWLHDLDRARGDVRVERIGTSTEGRPLDAVIVSDLLASTTVDALAMARRREVAALLRGDRDPVTSRPVALITSGIHATEVGGPQGIPALLRWLLGDSREARMARQRLVTIIVPTLNPDGMDVVQRWHERTAGTDRQGSEPPLLYHRFAGHDNNRDWLYRNLVETRGMLDRIHATWWPHVTLDQHQMHPHGPRFVLPPYADPWEPHVPPAIIAASAALGQGIASDMTGAGLAGVTTGRYFDAWEPSRAPQHYRGGVRILAEAASARTAYPIDVTPAQLAAAPLPQPITPSASTPLPWQGGRWTLGDIITCHLAAAQSLLRRVASDPEVWLATQAAALAPARGSSARHHLHVHAGLPDPVAATRLASMVAQDAWPDSAPEGGISLEGPGGALARAVLMPKSYPAEHGPAAYDVTSHWLPPMLGTPLAADRAAAGTGAVWNDRYLVIDARCHAAPDALEAAIGTGELAAWRLEASGSVNDRPLPEASWVVDRAAAPEAAAMAVTTVPEVPSGAMAVTRRDVVLLAPGDTPTPDHGWTRWWLQARGIPFREARLALARDLERDARHLTILVADTPVDAVDANVLRALGDLMAAGAEVIAVGGAGRALAVALAPDVKTIELGHGSGTHAPGALIRLVTVAGEPAARGLDRFIPAMVQRDGAFAVPARATGVHVAARYAARGTVISGWMSDPRVIRDAPAVLRIPIGRGALHAFAFRPLFRGQMLVTAPLVHNLLYPTMESPPCPASDRAKTPVARLSGRTS